MELPAARSPTSSLQDPDVASVASFIGADGTNPTTNSGRLSITLKPRDERKRQRRRDHRAPAAQARRGRRHRRLSAVGAGSADRQPRQPHAVPVHARRRRPRRARRVGAASVLDEAAARCRELTRRRERPADRRPPGVAHHRSRHRLAPRHLAAGDRRHALRRVRAAAGLDHLHAAQPVPRDPRGEAGVRRRPATRSTRSTCARRRGDQVPLCAVRALRARRPRRSRSTTRGSSRRSRSRSTWRPASSLGDAVDAISSRRDAASACRRAFTRDFAGTAQAFQRVARERADPDPRGAHHRLHRARRALRELHPPDHDPLDAAVGRRRRAARADGLPRPSSASSRSSASSCSSAS